MGDYERFRGCRECGLELPILVLAIYEPSPGRGCVKYFL
jgi:hypothetical protein